MEGQEEGLARDHHESRAVRTRVSALVQACPHTHTSPRQMTGGSGIQRFSEQAFEPDY